MISEPDTQSLYKTKDGHRRAMAAYDGLCKRIAVPYESVWLNTQVGLTHALIAGAENAPPLVLLHGQGASAPTWFGQINLLAERYRVIALDVPASMGKSTATRLPRTGTLAGEWLAAALKELNIPKVHLVGISNGAWLIMKLATTAPELIKSATLLSAAGIVPTSLKLMVKAVPFLAMGPLLSPARKAQMFARMMGVPDKATPEQDIEMFTILLGDFKMEPTPSPLSAAELACLTAPTQLLIGEHEAAFPPPSVIDQAKTVLPNLVYTEVLPKVGHGMISEDAALISGRIHQFVQRIEDDNTA